MKSLLVGFIVCFMQLPLFRVKLYYNVCVWNFPEGRGTTCFPFQSFFNQVSSIFHTIDIKHFHIPCFSSHTRTTYMGFSMAQLRTFLSFFFRLPIVNICYITTLFCTTFSLYFPFFRSFSTFYQIRSIYRSVRFGSVFVLQLIFCPIIAWNKAI